MTKGQKDKLWAEMDALAEEISGLSGPENEAARKAKELTLFEKLYKVFEGSPKRDFVSEFFLISYHRFDPSKKPFSVFVNSEIGKRGIDVYWDDISHRKETVFDEVEGKVIEKNRLLPSLDSPIPGGDGSTLLSQLGEDKQAEQPFRALEDRSDEILLRLSLLMLELPSRLHGKANNPTRMSYFRMFFTDGVTVFLKDETNLDAYTAHERDLFHAMNLSFLDFYMEQACRTVSQVAVCPLKPYGSLVEGRLADQETRLPLPADVFLSYRHQTGDEKASSVTISQQRKAYQEFLGDMKGSLFT